MLRLVGFGCFSEAQRGNLVIGFYDHMPWWQEEELLPCYFMEHISVTGYNITSYWVNCFLSGLNNNKFKRKNLDDCRVHILSTQIC